MNTPPKNKYCCDYDSIVHYLPGEFCTKYKTTLSDKIRPIPLNGTLPEDLAKTFANRTYHRFLTTEACVLYRVFGQISKSNKPNEKVSGARALGGFASTEFAESIIDAKMRLALNPSWLNTKMYEEKILLPAGQTIIVGIVASVTLQTGSVLPGGADQILLPKDWPESWIIGYRRITERQLQFVPQYRLGKPPEFDVCAKPGDNIKNTLYRAVCPRCCSENVRKLPASEIFTITGSKGNQYEMRFSCNEPDCGYYW